MKILICDKLAPEGVAILREAFTVEEKFGLTEAELIEEIKDYDGVVVRSQTTITAAIIESATKLKVIGRAGVGVDNIDVNAATLKGVIVINSPDGNTMSATEHTIALMLSLARKIPEAHMSMVNGKWDRNKFVGTEMNGKTLGVFGLGRIGGGVVKRMQAMEMKIIAYDPFISKERSEQLGIELVDEDTLFKNADFITLHMPLTDETRNLINAESIAKMKDNVYIINCARGGLIDLEALRDGLLSGKIKGAAIDVYPKEPFEISGSPLEDLEGLVLTPHLGASTEEAQIGVAVDVARNMKAVFKGEAVLTAVNLPPVSSAVMTVLKPYFDLAEKLGRIAIHLTEGRINEVEVEYSGDLTNIDVAPLTPAVIKGLLDPILQDAVNSVNALKIAKMRNIVVKTVKTEAPAYFANIIKVKVKTNETEHKVVGTLFDNKAAKIVGIDSYHIDFPPNGYLLLTPHIDQPNMIGQIASILGKNNINIIGMQVGKTAIKGTNIMAIAIEVPVAKEILAELKNINGILEMKLINCN